MTNQTVFGKLTHCQGTNSKKKMLKPLSNFVSSKLLRELNWSNSIGKSITYF